MINIRYGMWETNSSTVNQLVIHKGSFAHDRMYKTLVLSSFDPTDLCGETFTDIEHKARYVYQTCEEIRRTKKYWDKVMKKNPQYFVSRYKQDRKISLDLKSREAKNIETWMFKLLDEHAIKYEIKELTTEVNQGDYYNYDLFGEPSLKSDYFKSKDVLEAFLFSNKSAITYSYKHCAPFPQYFGYLEKNLDDDQESYEI